MSASECKTNSNKAGFTVAIIALPLYFIALILNILNYIYLRFISEDKKRLSTYVSYYSLNMVFFKIGVILYSLDLLKNDFFMGDYACKYMYVSMELGNYMTTLLVMCICLDQYQFVFHFHTYLQRFTKPWFISLSLFFISFIFCVPFFFLFHTEEKCGIKYCIVSSSTWYNIVLFCKLCIFFISPSIIMLVLYIKILSYLHNRKIATSFSKDKIRQKDSFGDDLTEKYLPEENNHGTTIIKINLATEKSSLKIGQYQRTIIHLMMIFGFFFFTALPYFVLRGLYEPLKLPPILIKSFYIIWSIGHSFHPLLYTIANKKMKKDVIKRIKKLFNTI